MASKLSRIAPRGASGWGGRAGSYDLFDLGEFPQQATTRTNPFVKGELEYWGRWLFDTTRVDGFRIDACKHIRSNWFPE